MNVREATAADTEVLAALVSDSNKDVAARFGLNPRDCPKHPAFCTADWIRSERACGAAYLIAEEAGQPVGCVAYERSSPELAYLNRLSVLPLHRRHGVGARLVDFVLGLAVRDGARTVSIGVIGEHIELQAWYAKLGFAPGALRSFPHLPFQVRYMACDVRRRCRGKAPRPVVGDSIGSTRSGCAPYAGKR